MGGAARFATLLAAPTPPLRPGLVLLHRHLSSLSVAPLRLFTLSAPSKTKLHTPRAVSCFHSQTSNNTYSIQSAANQQHPWPEWSNFLNIVVDSPGYSASEHSGILPEDAFVVFEELPEDFVRAAAACLAFARARPNLLRLLSRQDIEAVVSNGTPFLFKSALDAARRMRMFLGTDESSVSEFDKANTVDLMKYILSYSSNPAVSSGRTGLYSRELVDTSVRNLLHELAVISCGVSTGYAPNSGHQFSGRDGQTPKPFGHNIEMKRGDWICQRCNCMNFARNTKCLECEEPRPKKQLTGREWECPQCNFFNHGRNAVCLRCDSHQPGASLFNTTIPHSVSGNDRLFSHKTNMDERLIENEEKALHQFSQISQLADTSSTASEDDFPEITPLRKGDKFVAGTSLAEDSQFPKDSEHWTDKEKEQAEMSERWFEQVDELHNTKDLGGGSSDDDFPDIMPMRKGENRFVVSKKKDRSLTSPKYKRQVAMDQATKSNFVPFVPFPPGYFARKDTKQSSNPDSPASPTTDTSSHKMMPDIKKSDYPKSETADTRTVSRTVHTTGTPNTINNNIHSDGNSETWETPLPATGGAPSRPAKWDGDGSTRPPEWDGEGSTRVWKSLEGSAVKEPDPLDMSEEAKAERWFKRVAQIKDISELSQIPDEDFPSIMPMRKGVNRFVVSKRKTPLERRLTSRQYRRNLPIASDDSVNKASDNSSET